MMVWAMTGLIIDIQDFWISGVLGVVVWVVIFARYKSLFMGHIRAWLGGGQLPPGSMGIPYWGETLSYDKAWGRQGAEVDLWYSKRRKQHGDVFKTHLLGSPTIVMLGPSANKFVLSNEDRLFTSSWPKSMRELEGPLGVAMLEGVAHRQLRRAVRAFVGPDALRRVLPRIEACVVEGIHQDWRPGQIVNVYASLRNIVFRMNAEVLMGASTRSPILMTAFERHFRSLHKGLFSLPLDLPWTVFGKAMKARRALLPIIYEQIGKRKEELKERGEMEPPRDLLDLFLAYRDEEREGKGYTYEEMGDNLLPMMHAGQDTISAWLTSILRLLSHNPSILQDLREECLKMAEKKQSDALTWEDLKSMEFMHHCIQEGLRISSPVNIMFKKAKKDILYNGYTIPKGWQVQLPLRQTHNDEEFFPEPEKFDPSRFKVRKGGYTYLPFGQGLRICPGMDFAKINMQLLIYHILINFKWELVDPNEKMVVLPFFSQPEKGLPIRIL